MKKQHIFFGLILVTLYILYLILSYKYKEYKVNSKIDSLETLKTSLSFEIKRAESLIEYKTTKAYKNKILKAEQQLKNKGEEVTYVVTEERFKKFTSPEDSNAGKQKVTEVLDSRQEKIKTMTNFQKWVFFIFERDIR